MNSQTDIDIEKGQNASSGKDSETGYHEVSLRTFIDARYDDGKFENAAGYTSVAVVLGFLIGVFYAVDMAMNYNRFGLIP